MSQIPEFFKTISHQIANCILPILSILSIPDDHSEMCLVHNHLMILSFHTVKNPNKSFHLFVESLNILSMNWDYNIPSPDMHITLFFHHKVPAVIHHSMGNSCPPL